MPVDYSGVEKRSDVLCYTSPEFQQATILLGSPRLEFYASSSAVDTDFVIRLTVLTREGKSIRLSDNVLNAKHRNTLETMEFLTPGKVEKYEIRLPYFAHQFQKGEALRLEITSSAQGDIAPNPNTGRNIFKETKSIPAEQKIYYTKEYPSALYIDSL